jgi:hypothetical protein
VNSYDQDMYCAKQFDSFDGLRDLLANNRSTMCTPEALDTFSVVKPCESREHYSSSPVLQTQPRQA